MTHMKKIFCILLLCLVITGFCISAGCVQERENIRITIKVPSLTMNAVVDPDISTSENFMHKAFDAFAAQYDKYDISANIIDFPQTEYDKYITDCYNTEKAADMIYGGYFTISSFIHDGYAVPLDDIISEQIRADFDQGYWDASKASENGKTYLMPYTNLQNILVFNEDLFKQAGLDKYCGKGNVIQSWTLEEWNTVLATLKKNLPEDIYPMMMYAKNNQGDTHTMVLLRCQGSTFFDDNGRFNVSTPEGIAALKWIKDNYDKGYYVINCEDLEITDNTLFFTNGQLAISIGNPALNEGFEEAGLNLGYVNFPSKDGKGYASSFVTGFMVFDTGDAKRLEVTKDFVKFIYENEEMLAYSAGGIPCSKSISAKYGDQISGGADMYIENNKHVIDYTANNPNWLGVREAFYPNIHALLTGEMTPEQAANAIDEACNAEIEDGYRNSILHA